MPINDDQFLHKLYFQRSKTNSTKVEKREMCLHLCHIQLQMSKLKMILKPIDGSVAFMEQRFKPQWTQNLHL
ncbi:hypothetical protein L596_028736 [Steinernema carpocapsae]|uniref:Uncharacterized protein n=1 Tax=Steinernema carpocapsae TaxID=34508 RepID=A0A4U5LZ93_STECR|nr:hypothetical protein L596_028736 [Steinernema carpocapsae]